MGCEDGITFQFINDFENNDSFLIKSADNLNKKSLPKQNSFFDATLSEDLESIISTFDLNSVVLEDDDILEELSSQFDSDIIRLHFENQDQVVEHGLIDTNVLGEFLVLFNNLYSEVAKDRFLGVERKNNARSIRLKPIFDDSRKTQVVVGNEAASFAIYIKPRESFIRINDDVILNCSDIINDINTLFSLSKNSQTFTTIVNRFNKAVFRELSVFSEKTHEYGLNFDIKYYNTRNKTKSSDSSSSSDGDDSDESSESDDETKQI
jgi:hypothetical protein